MKMPTSDNVKAAAIMGGIVIASFLVWKTYKNAQAVIDAGKKVVTEKLNPVSDKNVAYAGVNSILQNLTGDENATLGTKIYDWIH